MDLTHALRLTLSPARPDVVSFVGGGGKTSSMFRAADEVVAGGQRAITATTTRIFAAQVFEAPCHLAIGDALPDWDALARLLDRHGQVMLVTSATMQKAVGVPPHLMDAVAAQAERLNVAALFIEADGSRKLPIKAPADYEPVLPSTTTHLVPIAGMDAIGLPVDAEHVHRPERISALLNEARGEGRGAKSLNLPISQSPNPQSLTPRDIAHLLTHPDGGGKGGGPGVRLIPLLNKADGPVAKLSARLAAHAITQRGHPALIGSVGRAWVGEEVAPIWERWGPVDGVILAAGAGSRFGGVKQVATVDGVPLVVRAARTALDSHVRHVWVITGAHVGGVDGVLAPLIEQAGGRLRVVHNPAWAAGQSTSMHLALDSLHPGAEAVIFLPVDQPFVPSSLLNRLIQGWRSGAVIAAPQVDGQLRGAPALFDRGVWDELRAITGDVGGRPVLKAHAAGVCPVTSPETWLRDVDTLADLAGLGEI